MNKIKNFRIYSPVFGRFFPDAQRTEASGRIPRPEIPRVGSGRMPGSPDIRFPAHYCPRPRPPLFFSDTARSRYISAKAAPQNSYSLRPFLPPPRRPRIPPFLHPPRHFYFFCRETLRVFIAEERERNSGLRTGFLGTSSLEKSLKGRQYSSCII